MVGDDEVDEEGVDVKDISGSMASFTASII